MPHIIRKSVILGGTTLAVFMTLVHTVNYSAAGITMLKPIRIPCVSPTVS